MKQFLTVWSLYIRFFLFLTLLNPTYSTIHLAQDNFNAEIATFKWCICTYISLGYIFPGQWSKRVLLYNSQKTEKMWKERRMQSITGEPQCFCKVSHQLCVCWHSNCDKWHYITSIAFYIHCICSPSCSAKSMRNLLCW